MVDYYRLMKRCNSELNDITFNLLSADEYYHKLHSVRTEFSKIINNINNINIIETEYVEYQISPLDLYEFNIEIIVNKLSGSLLETFGEYSNLINSICDTYVDLDNILDSYDI